MLYVNPQAHNLIREFSLVLAKTYFLNRSQKIT